MWSVVVVLPTVQAEFGTPRADASLPFTITMMGFAVGNVGMGWLADRFGIVRPLMLGASRSHWDISPPDSRPISGCSRSRIC